MKYPAKYYGKILRTVGYIEVISVRHQLSLCFMMLSRHFRLHLVLLSMFFSQLAGRLTEGNRKACIWPVTVYRGRMS